MAGDVNYLGSVVYWSDLIFGKASEEHEENTGKGCVKTPWSSAIDKDVIFLFFFSHEVSRLPHLQVCKGWRLHGEAGNLLV